VYLVHAVGGNSDLLSAQVKIRRTTSLHQASIPTDLKILSPEILIITHFLSIFVLFIYYQLKL
jgi:hypothetical protein